ncbi:hypothetical protein QE385_002691 [Sphingomonas sp. SORGH_AS 950]|nr:hypothetical protein [Sphingomonas sp. SORGH_AS_0950]
MTRLRGWCARGRPLVDKVPHGHWRTLTFLAVLRHDRIDAPLVLDGPIDGESFTAYVEQFLLPTLSPGDIVVMDNLGSHKGKAVRQLIRSVGAKLLFLPPPASAGQALLTRPQPHRAGLRQAQDTAPQGQHPIGRGDMEADRFTP